MEKLHDTTTECHLPYGIFSAIEMRCIILRYINFLFYSILFYSSVTCYLTLANTALCIASYAAVL